MGKRIKPKTYNQRWLDYLDGVNLTPQVAIERLISKHKKGTIRQILDEIGIYSPNVEAYTWLYKTGAKLGHHFEGFEMVWVYKKVGDE